MNYGLTRPGGDSKTTSTITSQRFPTLTTSYLDKQAAYDKQAPLKPRILASGGTTKPRYEEPKPEPKFEPSTPEEAAAADADVSPEGAGLVLAGEDGLLANVPRWALWAGGATALLGVGWLAWSKMS